MLTYNTTFYSYKKLMLECVWEIESEILVPQMNWTKIFKVAGSGKDDKYSKAFKIVVTDQNFSYK